MSRTDPPYPLPVALVTEVEMAMADLPDRGGAVWRLRDLIGRIYAQGHIDGRMQRMTEERYDRQAEADQGMTEDPGPAPYGMGTR